MALTTIPVELVTLDDGVTITVDDNSDNLTLTSTDADANSGPNLLLKRDNNSAAGDDVTGTIVFQAEDAGNNLTDYIAFKTMIQDATGGSEDGRLKLELMSGGTARNILDISGSNAVVFNEDSQDIDFRVESNGNANTFTVDGGTDEVRVPHNVAAQTLASFIVRENGAALEFGHQNNGGQYYGTLGAFGSNGDPYIGFATDCESSANTFTTRGSKGCLITNGSGDMRFMAVTSASATGQTPAERVRIRNDGGITFNGDTAAANALDDYEEGDWTPSIGTGTFASADAHYIKIGRLVKFSCRVNTFNDITTNTSIAIGGLPYPVETNQAMGSVMGIYTDNTDADTTYANTSETLYFYSLSSGSWDAMTHADINNSSADFYVQGSYRTT